MRSRFTSDNISFNENKTEELVTMQGHITRKVFVDNEHNSSFCHFKTHVYSFFTLFAYITKHTCQNVCLLSVELPFTPPKIKSSNFTVRVR